MSSIVKQSAIIGAGRIVIAAIIFVSDAILSRHLGVTGKGEYFFIYNIIFTTSIILTSGIEYGNFYYFSKASKQTLLLNSSAYLFFISIILFLFGPIILNQFQEINSGTSEITILIILGILLETLFIVFISFLLATGKTLAYVSSRFIRRALFLFVISIFFMTKTNTTVSNCMVVYVASISVGLIFIILQIRLYFSSYFYLDIKLFRKTFFYGIKTHTGQIAEQLHRRCGIFFLGFFSTTSSIGLYSVAIGIAELSLFISNAASIALLSQVNVDKKQLQEDTSLITRHTTLLAILSAIILAIFGNYIIMLCFGSLFAESYYALLLTLPGITLYSYYPSLKSYLINSGNAHLTTLCSFFGLLANVTFNFILIPTLGIKGAALSITFSYGLASLLILFITAKSSKKNILSYILLNGKDIRRLKTIPQYIVSVFRNKYHV